MSCVRKKRKDYKLTIRSSPSKFSVFKLLPIKRSRLGPSSYLFVVLDVLKKKKGIFLFKIIIRTAPADT